MKVLLRQLLEKLESVGDHHEEVFDTDVREKLADAVAYGFLKPIEGFEIPTDYAMYSASGNAAVQDVIAWFIPLANERARALGLDSFHKRLNAFQDDNVETERQSTYDEFFGWAKPDEYDEDGNFMGR